MNDEYRWLPEVQDIIAKHLYVKLEGDCYYGDIYVDYNDRTISEETITTICENDHPRDFWNEKLWEWEIDQRYYELENVKDIIKAHLSDEYLEAFDDEIVDWIDEHFYFNYNSDDFDTTVYADIIVDTGDGNYDYTLNCVYPHYNGREGDIIDNKASIVWLTKQQGYKKSQLNKALHYQEYNDSKFLESIWDEIANCTSHMNALTFLVQMSLSQWFDLNDAINEEKHLYDEYDASKSKGIGYIILDKNTTCMLYDPWNGAGSLREISLENDVKLPLKFIDTMLPDGSRGYGVSDIYGVDASSWSNSLQEIHCNKKNKKINAA